MVAVSRFDGLHPNGRPPPPFHLLFFSLSWTAKSLIGKALVPSTGERDAYRLPLWFFYDPVVPSSLLFPGRHVSFPFLCLDHPK